MATAIIVPKLGLTMTKATVVKWLKNEGDPVKKGEAVVQIETDKVTNRIESSESGLLLKILAQPKSVVAVAGILGYIGQSGETIPTQSQHQAMKGSDLGVGTTGVLKSNVPVSPRSAQVRVSPRARLLIAEKGIDVSRLNGRGPDGMIMESDVVDFITAKLEKTNQGLKVKQLIPISPTRNAISNNMLSSLQSMAQVSITMECSAEAIKQMRAELEKKEGTNNAAPTYTDILVKTVAAVLMKHPIMNSTMEEDQIKLIEEINIGVGVAVETGLIVPVINDADKKTIHEISDNLRVLVQKAKKNELSFDDVSRGTFTITNLGTYGVDSFTPIINPPQSAILGVGQIRDIALVRDGQIRVTPSMVLSLTFDHRVMDGHVAATFLKELKQTLEDPILLSKSSSPM